MLWLKSKEQHRRAFAILAMCFNCDECRFTRMWVCISYDLASKVVAFKTCTREIALPLSSHMQNITFTAFNKSRTLMQKRQRLRMKCFVLPERYFLIETKLSPKNVPAKIFHIYFWQKKYAQKHNLKFEKQTWNNWSKLVVIK